jgi:hypothetical protein
MCGKARAATFESNAVVRARIQEMGRSKIWEKNGKRFFENYPKRPE